jgi:predicted AlkP superfamily pyrophosphatase or phosphodiesterase
LINRRYVWSSLGLLLFVLYGRAWAEPPRLVVVISIDQMRADYLDVFADHYDGGFRSLRELGAVFVDGHQDYAFTQTAAGHATISSGVFPSRHGMVANEFYDRLLEQPVGAVDDPTTNLIGAGDARGSSPSRVQRPGLSDWLKAQSPASKVASVSIKDRAAILLGGTAADTAYWLDLQTGHFVTSDHYSSALPAWATEFNLSGSMQQYNGTVWQRLMPDEVYDISPWPELAGQDSARFRSLPRDLGARGEPPNRRYYLRLRGSPFGDLETLKFARALIESEDYGRDQDPDLLFIGLSATDYIGHRAGPYSDEMHDQMLRLDGYLEEFFNFLDAHVDSRDYVIAVSADHGAAPVPEQLPGNDVNAGRVDPDEMIEFVAPVLEAAHARGDIGSIPDVYYLTGPAFRFSGEPPPPAKLDALRRAVAERLLDHPSVAAVYTYDDQLNGAVDDAEWGESISRSFHPDRAADVTVRLKQNHILRPAATGTSHGSPYRYDTHVPIVFFGVGVVAGEHTERARTTDIAPTLARILEINAPEDLDGRSLYESFEMPQP